MIGCKYRQHPIRAQPSDLRQSHVRLHWAHEGVSGFTGGEANCGAGGGAGVPAVICLRFLSGRLCTVRQAGFAGCEGPLSSIAIGGGISGRGCSCFATFEPNMKTRKLRPQYLGCPIRSEFASSTVFGLDSHQLSDLAERCGRQLPVRV